MFQKRDLIYTINKNLDFPKILKEFGKYVGTSGSLFCPFHNDKNHPSAKFYHDNDGWRLHCFAEQKQYRPWDFFYLLGWEPEQVIEKYNLIIEKIIVRSPINYDPFINDQELKSFKQGKILIDKIFEILAFRYCK